MSVHLHPSCEISEGVYLCVKGKDFVHSRQGAVMLKRPVFRCSRASVRASRPPNNVYRMRLK